MSAVVGSTVAGGGLNPKEVEWVADVCAGSTSAFHDSPCFSAWIECAFTKEKEANLPLAKIKLSRRIAVVTNFRLLLLTPPGGSGLGLLGSKTPGDGCHLFDIESIDDAVAGSPPRGSTFRLFVRDTQAIVDGTQASAKTRICIVHSEKYAAAVLEATLKQHANISAGFASGTRKHPFDIEVSIPAERLSKLVALNRVRATVGAAAMLNTYRAMCMLRNEPFAPAFRRFVEDLIEQGQPTLPLHRCPGIDHKSSMALSTGSILQALNFTPYFRALIFRELDCDNFNPALCVRYSTVLTKLVVTRVEGSVDWLGLARAIRLNTELQLQLFDCSHNALKAKESLALAQALACANHGFYVLRMAYCHIKPKAMQELCVAFLDALPVSLTLRELDFSGNVFGEEGTRALSNWLTIAGANAELRRLVLSHSSLHTGTLFHEGTGGSAAGGILAPLKHLERVDVSGAEFEPGTWSVLVSAIAKNRQFTQLIASSCKGVGTTGVRDAYIALLRHRPKKWRRVDLIIEGLLLTSPDGKPHGGELFAPIPHFRSRNYPLRVLNLARCNITADGLAYLFGILEECCMTLTELMIGGNTHWKKDGQACELLLRKLVLYLESGTSLLRLSLKGAKNARFGRALAPLFEYMARDNSLELLDVSDNKCSDAPFFYMADALYTNQRLRALHIDGNNLGFNSLLLLERAMKSNSYLCEMPLVRNEDVKDIYAHYRSVERANLVTELIVSIQSRLGINVAAQAARSIVPSLPEPGIEGQAWKTWADNDNSAPPAIAGPLAVPLGKSARQEPSRTKTFGVPLSFLPGDFSLVDDCIRYIDRKALDSEGIFRLSGSVTAIKDLQQRFNTGQRVSLDDIMDPNIVAGLLKLWLRELPEPLFPTVLHRAALQVSDNKNEEIRNSLYVALVQGMGEPNRSILGKLMALQRRIVANEHVNKMTARNMATVFAPNILRASDHELLKETQRLLAVWDHMYTIGESLFSEGVREFAATGTARSGAAPGTLGLMAGDVVFVLQASSNTGVVAGTGQRGEFALQDVVIDFDLQSVGEAKDVRKVRRTTRAQTRRADALAQPNCAVFAIGAARTSIGPGDASRIVATAAVDTGAATAALAGTTSAATSQDSRAAPSTWGAGTIRSSGRKSLSIGSNRNSENIEALSTSCEQAVVSDVSAPAGAAGVPRSPDLVAVPPAASSLAITYLSDSESSSSDEEERFKQAPRRPLPKPPAKRS